MAVNKKYASVKLIKTISPVTKKFEEVRERILPQYKAQAEKNALDALAKEKLTQIDNEELNVSTFITLNNAETQNFGLNQQETSDFVSKLFTSTQEKGIIPIGSNIVVYKIIEQKLIPLESNSTDVLYSNADQVKRQTFEKNLMEELDKKYPTTIYQ
jgi:peptidyl-prolyl cis-trans isomerase D